MGIKLYVWFTIRIPNSVLFGCIDVIDLALHQTEKSLIMNQLFVVSM